MIYIFRDDDTNFDNQQFLKIKVNSDKDMAGWIAKFELGNLVYTFNNINIENEVIITAEQSRKLPYGSLFGTFYLLDNEKRRKTLSNTIPFYVSKHTKSNKPQTIYLNTFDDSNISVNIDIATLYLKVENLKAGNNIEIDNENGVCTVSALMPSIENFATKEEVNKKQDKGNYALKSEIPNISNLASKDEIPTLISQLENDSNFTTQTQVMQAIASIPQFKLSIVSELPTTGEKMTLYLVPKEGSGNDVYNEYIWVENTSTFEFIGSTAVDLTDYVKNTDYATTTKAGLVKVQSTYGTSMSGNQLMISNATENEIDSKASKYKAITPSNLLYAVNSVLPTMTQAEYDALATKDENLFYMIVEE